MDKITIVSNSGALGDNLAFTPIFDVANVTFKMVDHPKSRNVSRLFDDMCKVVFVNDDNLASSCKEDMTNSRHIIQKKLDGLGISGKVRPIPRINYKRFYPEFEEEARDKLSVYKNPIAFVYNNNDSLNATNMMARYKLPPQEYVQQHITKLVRKGFDVLQFGMSNNVTKFHDVHEFFDIPLDGLAVYYSLIGKYVGVDTGDYHLMVAVGGTCDVFVPPHSYLYSHDEWHYKKHFWGDESPRVRYHGFEELL